MALYALEQQATRGPCTESKPWGWNVIESAKWQGWSQLGDMASVEAMRLFVRLLEDERVSTITACAANALMDTAKAGTSAACRRTLIAK